jgi:RNA polymerase sigma-70 factor (ECF subfamily)
MQPALNAIDYETLTDAELLPRLQRGERAAFGAIIQRHNRRLYRVARGVLRDDNEAEDVVQETYVRAFGSIAAFRGEASLSTWLTRIALNEALDRKRRRRPEVDLAVLDDPKNRLEDSVVPLFPSQAEGNPEKQSARAEIRRLVEAAVEALPETFRLVFLMRDIEEMSVEETATHLGLKPETVKTRLHRARRILRGRLEDTLAAALTDSFPFAGDRCAAMTERVMKRLGVR